MTEFTKEDISVVFMFNRNYLKKRDYEVSAVLRYSTKLSLLLRKFINMKVN